MKKKFLITILILAVLTISACGGEATPEINVEDLAATAAAEAWLAVTQTAAAMPSPTIELPTFTPQPTNTLAPIELVPTQPLPTQAAAVAPAATAACDQIPTEKPVGYLVNVEFFNQSEGSANFAFGMNTPNDKGECFTYTFIIGKGDSLQAKVLGGCYWGYAWIEGAESSVAKSGDVLICVQDANFPYKIKITKETVGLK